MRDYDLNWVESAVKHQPTMQQPDHSKSVTVIAEVRDPVSSPNAYIEPVMISIGTTQRATSRNSSAHSTNVTIAF